MAIIPVLEYKYFRSNDRSSHLRCRSAMDDVGVAVVEPGGP